MKRFTRWRDDYRIICPKHMQRDYKGDFTGPVVEKLAAYEDTELTPSQVIVLQEETKALRTELALREARMEELEFMLASAKSER